MQFQIALLILLATVGANASNEKAMQDLFKKYDQVMDDKKVELIDEIFTQKFLQESGGKEEFILKVKSLPVDKNEPPLKMTWRQGVKSKNYYARLKNDAKSKEADSSEFIVILENGKLKIDGTAGDAE